MIANIKTPDAFIAFMESVWEIHSEPADGGLLLTAHRDYDRYHNARKTARLVGMSRTGGTKIDGIPAETYRWPNGDGVRITLDGNMVAPIERGFGSRS